MGVHWSQTLGIFVFLYNKIMCKFYLIFNVSTNKEKLFLDSWGIRTFFLVIYLTIFFG